MFISGLFSTVADVAKGNARNDDDIFDRLNHRYTTIFLCIFTVLVSTTQYVGDPIQCWAPAYFTSSHTGYADKVCWVTNNYYLPAQEIAGQPGATKKHIGYYQWVPIVLLVQAFMFFLPCLFWRILNDSSGINVNNLVEAAGTIQNALYPERRNKTLQYMTRQLEHYLQYQREYRDGCCTSFTRVLAKYLCLDCGNRFGKYLIVLYLFTKILYFFNVIGQLFLLNSFLGTEYHIYGFEVIQDLIAGNDWTASKIFPRVTLCDFTIRQMGNFHRHTLQCVLSINLFNEKIYMVVWFWFVFVAAATCFGFLKWVWTMGFPYSRIRFVRNHLKVLDKLRGSDREKKASHRFVEKYLRQDGCFILKLIATNSTDLVVADIVGALWDNYYPNPSLQDRIDTKRRKDSGSVV